MWPTVDVEARRIKDFLFDVMDFNVEDIENPNICIKEIVMLFANFSQVEYDKNDVALVVSYDTEFGIHTILFSKVESLNYVNNGVDWIAVFSSQKDQEVGALGDGLELEEEILTEMFKNMLKEVQIQLENWDEIQRQRDKFDKYVQERLQIRSEFL